ncbi:MAG: GNAT family N-acetyltransferase [Rikenellaceae bacterium]|nr:GNAT family N-acetyltransferase [Rikenellaceae bacterium]
MIRMFTPADEDAVIRIWLDASKLAHDFVEPGFWESKEQAMRREYLPTSRVWVYDDDLSGEVVGFLALKDHYVEALFVEPGRQGEGIGFQLLEKAKEKEPKIELSVYQENPASVAFYERQGFRIIGESIDPETGHPQWRMRFRM